jgi:16S rRNA (cytidine1402-2'-O)-methyltransferase
MTNELIAALYVVPTPLGNLSDLSRRAEAVLRDVPWVAAEDTRHSAPLLKQLGSAARTLPAHQHNEHEAAARIVEAAGRRAGGADFRCRHAGYL